MPLLAPHHWPLCGTVPRLWQVWALKCCFPESRPNIPPCFVTYNGHENSSDSPALSQWEEEQQWRIVFCLSIIRPAAARAASYASPSPFSTFTSRMDWIIPSRWGNIIWFWNKTLFHSVMSLAGSTHTLCGSLISSHSFLKCSSIHLERMLWLSRGVERISSNECWQRQTLLVLTFYCLDWVLVSQDTHTLSLHAQI